MKCLISEWVDWIPMLVQPRWTLFLMELQSINILRRGSGRGFKGSIWVYWEYYQGTISQRYIFYVFLINWGCKIYLENFISRG